MQEITQIYQSEKNKFENCREKVERLIAELLEQHQVKFHKLESRVKEPEKLDEKILRKNNKYKSIDDITDLVGVRIITYFGDEIDKIASLIESEFLVDWENSIDKRKLETDKFGYMSLHYVVSFSNDRKKLMEYKNFGDIKFEIQIRSILQHAWAEIEHDIGYKGENAIPDSVRRNFFRVAALLETADIEFVSIKKGLSIYEETVAERISSHPEDVEINGPSLHSFISMNISALKADQKLADHYNTRIVETPILNIMHIVDMIKYLDIKNIKELHNRLEENKGLIMPFLLKWTYGDKLERIGRGISIYYLCLILVAKQSDLKFSRNFYRFFFGDREVNRGDEINSIYKEIIGVQT